MDIKDYLNEVKENISKPKTDEIIKVIAITNFRVSEVEPNIKYFTEYFENGFSAYDAVMSIKKNQRDLFRKLVNIPDEIIENEYDDRDLLDLSSIDTDALEDELESRFSTKLKEIGDFSDYELVDELERRNYKDVIILNSINGTHFFENLAKILQLSNTFSYSKDELLNLITEKLNRC